MFGISPLVPGVLWVLLGLAPLAGCGGKGEDVDGDGFTTSWDCDDRDSRIHPDAIEVCDGIDNDCDGYTDGDHAEDATVWFIDYDGDGYGSDLYTLKECERPEGYESRSDDCDDANASIHPDMDELCDFLDGDCDGSVDEDAVDATTWYQDGDRDGYGARGTSKVSCVQPTGYTGSATDCDDADPEVHVGADERCNELDDDCDGRVDEDAVDATTWYADADRDGYGDPEVSEQSCEAPDELVALGTDCDDAAPDISPGEEEQCEDGKDNDCDETDNGCAPNGTKTLDEADAALLGGAAHDNAGASVSSAGDLDGDGDCEVLVGVPGSDAKADSAGMVAVLQGPLLGELALEEAPVLLYGVREGDAAGSAVAPAGDLDDDGYADVLIGAPTADGGEDSSGVAYLFAGPVAWTTRMSSADARLKGGAASDGAGSALAGVGDIDDDGYDDLLIGAPGQDDEGDGAGVAWLVFGPLTGGGALSDSGYALQGYGEAATAGRAVAGAGDVDGDGVPDLLVGAPGDEAGGSWAGSAYLIYGPVSASLLLTHEGVALRGEHAGDAAGWSVSGAGDTDGDGLDDVVIGSTSADGDASDSGVVYVVPGPVAAMDDLSSASGHLRGTESRGYVGWSVAGVGDLNRDGFTDLCVGSRSSDGWATDGGAAFLVYGPMSGSADLEGADAIFYGPGAGDLAGTSVAGAGDLDGDDFVDVLIGGPGADGVESTSGAAWLILGSGI